MLFSVFYFGVLWCSVSVKMTARSWDLFIYLFYLFENSQSHSTLTICMENTLDNHATVRYKGSNTALTSTFSSNRRMVEGWVSVWCVLFRDLFSVGWVNLSCVCVLYFINKLNTFKFNSFLCCQRLRHFYALCFNKLIIASDYYFDMIWYDMIWLF